METKKLYMGENADTSIKIAADILKSGGIVAIPTETVYGLAASAYDDNAIKKVFAAKGRPQDNPLIVHIADISELDKIAFDISEKAMLCANRFWPGPFTMVLKKTNKVAKSVSCGLESVAVRMPSDNVARRVISTSGLALAAPSANASGSPSPTSPEHVLYDLEGKIDAVIMGERSSVGLESTVVSFLNETPRLLRPGAVTVEQLKEVLGEIDIDPAVLESVKQGQSVASPGMKYKHYAPKCELYLVEGDTKSFANYVNKQNDGVALCFKQDINDLKCDYTVYGDNTKLSTAAYSLFDTLRELDGKGVKKAYVHAPDKTGVGLAVYNRLIRACAYKVVSL